MNQINRVSLRVGAWVLAASMLGIGVAQATLIDRGSGLIYDDVLNVTWMQNIADTPQLNWNDAVAYADSFAYYDSTRDTTWDDWRLPTAINSPSTLGYDTTGLSSELAYMYYVNLGFAPNYGHDRWDPSPTSSNYNPFTDMVYRAYWTGTLNDTGYRAYYLHFHFGSMEVDGIGELERVWLVRDGDVANSVPEPGSLGLFALGLLAFGGFQRRKRARANAIAA